ncbi:hypothetical protein TNCV_3995011 [Trichonephila clavipes]|nr:hypothetical protein TNCV_3995011 [Trichonephila clavipes]
MGSRTRGRPPTRWIDDVENDLKTLNILKTGRELLRIAVIGGSELWRQPRPVTGCYAYKEEVSLSHQNYHYIASKVEMMQENYLK